ncbi:MBOAT family O-acyltransferase [Desulfofustis limnaeus]|uniref:Alginate O-acetyltransferase n=1 Tax=Desulfofustis limnaeus TaxID=2740163 RepID=A0ABN6M445_9BACT|nr:MBOAT family protein [Desulfofustis limnaeus]BDD87620.1 alginate O-acetyltransferase [Desulfofustis limnaeus]
MLFNSFVFWLFFAAVLVLYRFLDHRWQNRMLLVASYVFYGYWDYRFLALIALSTVVDYVVALGIADSREPRHKKRLLIVSLVCNLGLLGFFKYFNFFVAQAEHLLALIGLPVSTPILSVVLPVGISFYTFQTMSYTIDVYRGRTTPTRDFLDFALYVSFFPQLVAGPIERSYRLLPQILEPRRVSRDDFAEGTYHVLIGLFKKVVVADNMAPIVNSVFSRPPSELSGTEVLVGLYAFAFQIYGDFSGYSSIAQGTARWLGFKLSWNFRMPYFAVNPSDFWQRWHITLSTWLRDYLYVPLGGNRGTLTITLRNLMITMFLGGLWHGANWTFIVWGLYHGALLVVYRMAAAGSWGGSNLSDCGRAATVLRVILFFHLVCLGWLFFRAESISQVGVLLKVLVVDQHLTDFAVYSAAMILFFAGPLLLLEYWLERSDELLRVVSSHWLVKGFIYCYFLLMIWLFPPLTQQVFIYFQF